MAWRKPVPDLFPAPLREFREAEWPPVEGECLGHYSCRADGYSFECAPREGVPCGQACYDHLALEYAERPEVLAAVLRADAYTRFHEARLSWLGKDSDGYVDEMIEGFQVHERIRYAPFRP
jgi:hypothetical protein